MNDMKVRVTNGSIGMIAQLLEEFLERNPDSSLLKCRTIQLHSFAKANRLAKLYEEQWDEEIHGERKTIVGKQTRIHSDILLRTTEDCYDPQHGKVWEEKTLLKLGDLKGGPISVNYGDRLLITDSVILIRQCGRHLKSEKRQVTILRA